jgi:NADPH:quinone reductase-like Zn-dependent oxidoreductase
MGARVIQTSGDAVKLARLLEMGAEAVIDYRADPDWDRQVLALTDGVGADVVIEVGGPGTLERSFRAVRVGGTIATIGFVGGGAEVNPRAVISRSIRLQGLTVGSCAQFRAMNRAVALSRMQPVIDRVFAFDEAAQAYDRLRAGAHFGKIVISV